MKADFIKRLEALEHKTFDWIAKLDILDFVGLTDYDNGEWEEMHFEYPFAAYRNVQTGEHRGVYEERRDLAEIREAGGNLEYL